MLQKVFLRASIYDMKKILVFFVVCLCGNFAFGGDLIGSAHVSMTSDTSSAAKTMAMNDARRQILTDKLSQYAMTDQLVPALKEAKSADLVPLISEINIDKEKISDTAYSAKFTMTIDKVAARAWMNENNVQNWLNDGTSTDMFVAQIVLKDAIPEWADFNRVMRTERVDAKTKYISGTTITVELPATSRTSLTIALRRAGWHTAVADDIMRVWK